MKTFFQKNKVAPQEQKEKKQQEEVVRFMAGFGFKMEVDKPTESFESSISSNVQSEQNIELVCCKI